jgi:hypothetical protein
MSAEGVGINYEVVKQKKNTLARETNFKVGEKLSYCRCESNFSKRKRSKCKMVGRSYHKFCSGKEENINCIKK